MKCTAPLLLLPEITEYSSDYLDILHGTPIKSSSDNRLRTGVNMPLHVLVYLFTALIGGPFFLNSVPIAAAYDYHGFNAEDAQMLSIISIAFMNFGAYPGGYVRDEFGSGLAIKLGVSITGIGIMVLGLAVMIRSYGLLVLGHSLFGVAQECTVLGLVNIQYYTETRRGLFVAAIGAVRSLAVVIPVFVSIDWLPQVAMIHGVFLIFWVLCLHRLKLLLPDPHDSMERGARQDRSPRRKERRNEVFIATLFYYAAYLTVFSFIVGGLTTDFDIQHNHVLGKIIETAAPLSFAASVPLGFLSDATSSIIICGLQTLSCLTLMVLASISKLGAVSINILLVAVVQMYAMSVSQIYLLGSDFFNPTKLGEQVGTILTMASVVAVLGNWWLNSLNEISARVAASCLLVIALGYLILTAVRVGLKRSLF